MSNLTQTLNLELNGFIVKAVRQNLLIPVQGTGPVTQKLTIQNLLNDASDATLKAFYEFLKRLPQSVGSELMGEEQIYYAGDVTSTELAHIVDIIRLHRKVQKEKNELTRKKEKLHKELSELETPEERRAKIKKELEALEQQV